MKLLSTSLLLFPSSSSLSSQRGASSSICHQRSNHTHVVWSREHEVVATSRRLDEFDVACDIQSMAQARQDAYKYLRQHAMQFDLPFLETLGFAADNNDDDKDSPDGLGNGLVGPTIDIALQAKSMYAFADAVPYSIWREYVLNYASTNEARSNWRPWLQSRLSNLTATWDRANTTMTISDAVKSLNTHMWTLLAPAHQSSIVFVSGQTPLIFDPMSTLVFGHASCTGLAILFVAALRTVGVPARVVGTPAWQQNISAGNHNWVEVYNDGQWQFLEPSPAQDTVDDLERDPCLRWFCQADRFTADPHTTTKVFAARLQSDNTYYPLAWEPSNHGVPGEDMSDYYQRICGNCK